MKSEDEPGRIVGRVVAAVPPLGVQVDDLSANVAAALKVLGMCNEYVRLPLVNVRPDIYKAIEQEVHKLNQFKAHLD